jgi:hypothetical protein
MRAQSLIALFRDSFALWFMFVHQISPREVSCALIPVEQADHGCHA